MLYFDPIREELDSIKTKNQAEFVETESVKMEIERNVSTFTDPLYKRLCNLSVLKV